MPFPQLPLPPPPAATCSQPALRPRDLSAGRLASDTQRLATRRSTPASRHSGPQAFTAPTFPRDEGGLRGTTTSPSPWSHLSAPARPRGLKRAHLRGPSSAALRPATDGASLGRGRILRSPEVSHRLPVPTPGPHRSPSSDNCKPHSNSREQACHFKQPGLFKQDNRLQRSHNSGPNSLKPVFQTRQKQQSAASCRTKQFGPHSLASDAPHPRRPTLFAGAWFPHCTMWKGLG